MGKRSVGSLPKPKTIISRILKHYEDEPLYDDREVEQAGKRAKKQGFYSKKDFEIVCGWKTPRQKNNHRKNTSSEIRKQTKAAFALIGNKLPVDCDKERQCILELTKLHGVGIPTASALLSVAFPKSYGIIDIRLWETLWCLGIIKDDKKRSDIHITQWIQAITLYRRIAKEHNVTVRRFEYSLFLLHQEYLQDGSLYDPKRILRPLASNKKALVKLSWLVK